MKASRTTRPIHRPHWEKTLHLIWFGDEWVYRKHGEPAGRPSDTVLSQTDFELYYDKTINLQEVYDAKSKV